MPAGFSLGKVIWAGALWILLLAASSAHGQVQITRPPADADTDKLEQTLKLELSKASAALGGADARITIGAVAFQQALSQNDRRPLVATYLTSLEFETALGARERPPYVTAVFSNPDPVAQVALARALLGQSRIGVFDSPESHSLVSRIATRGVVPIKVSPGQPIDSILRNVQALDAVVVLPDATVLNRSNISHVVRTLYQQRKVLIGHSATLTHVGALASPFASSNAIARATVEVLQQYAANGRLADPHFVRDLDVEVNERLARSLNIAVPDRIALLKVVRSAEVPR